MGSTVERIQAYISQREKIRDGGDTITECNGVPLELSDLREAVAAFGPGKQKKPAGNVEHRSGCPAGGGYGHGVESCICGAVADVEPLPLPEPAAGYGRGCNIELADGQPLYTAEQATAHARAVAEHNVAARDAEVERLKVVAHGFVDEIAAKDDEIEALQAEVREWKRVASAQAELHGTAEDHAQKLAAALQDLLGQLEGVGIYTPGEDAGQWQDAEGVSFTRAESALHEYQAEQATPQHNRGSGSKPGGMK